MLLWDVAVAKVSSAEICMLEQALQAWPAVEMYHHSMLRWLRLPGQVVQMAASISKRLSAGQSAIRRCIT